VHRLHRLLRDVVESNLVDTSLDFLPFSLGVDAPALLHARLVVESADRPQRRVSQIRNWSWPGVNQSQMGPLRTELVPGLDACMSVRFDFVETRRNVEVFAAALKVDYNRWATTVRPAVYFIDWIQLLRLHDRRILFQWRRLADLVLIRLWRVVMCRLFVNFRERPVGCKVWQLDARAEFRVEFRIDLMDVGLGKRLVHLASFVPYFLDLV